MVYFHRVSFAVLVLSLALPLAAQASTQNHRHSQFARGFALAQDDTTSDTHAAHAKDRGVVAGDVAEIDYGRGVITLHTQHRGKLEIVVSPSTSILDRNNEYGTISDISRGSRLSVFISEVDGRLVAQIIHIH